MLRWVLYAIGAVATMAALLVVIGWLLPVAHTATASRSIAGPRERVFAAITEFSRYPEWRTDVSRVDLEGPAGIGQIVREVGANGEIPYRVETLAPSSRLVMRIQDGLPFGGTWTYDLEPESDTRTVVTITENGEVYNPVFRVLSRFVFGHTATMDRYLRDLARRFGEG